MPLPTEKHPFKEFIPNGCEILIIGSFPPIKLTSKLPDNIADEGLKYYYSLYDDNSRNHITDSDIRFYYGSRDNLFWKKIIAPIFDITLESVADIKLFLTSHKIGITDLFEEISRNIVEEKLNSSDVALNIHESRNILSLIQNNDIKLIFSTSIYVTDYLNEYLYNFNNIEIITLPSPSKSASRGIGGLMEYQELKQEGLINDTIEYRQMKYSELFKNRI